MGEYAEEALSYYSRKYYGVDVTGMYEGRYERPSFKSKPYTPHRGLNVKPSTKKEKGGLRHDRTK